MFSDRLAQCQSVVLAEEVLSSTRHDVRNKLATIANAAQYLATRAKTTDIWSADPRMARFFGLIETHVKEANDLLESREPSSGLSIRTASRSRSQRALMRPSASPASRQNAIRLSLASSTPTRRR